MKKLITLFVLTIFHTGLYCMQDLESKENGITSARWSKDTIICCYNLETKSWSNFRNNMEFTKHKNLIFVRQGKKNPDNPELAKFKFYKFDTKLASLTCRIVQVRNTPNVIIEKIKLLGLDLLNQREMAEFLLGSSLQIMKDQHIKSVRAKVLSTSDKIEVFTRAGFTIEEIEKDQATDKTEYLFVKELH